MPSASAAPTESDLAAFTLAPGFHTAAADVYRRLARFKDAPAAPALEEILTALLQTEDAPGPVGTPGTPRPRG